MLDSGKICSQIMIGFWPFFLIEFWIFSQVVDPMRHQLSAFYQTGRKEFLLFFGPFFLMIKTIFFISQVVDPVCHQLFEFYRTGRKELQRFTLEFVPTLIEVYLVHISKNSKRVSGDIFVVIRYICCFHYNDVIMSASQRHHKSPASWLFTEALFRRRSKKTSKLHVTGLCEGNSSVTGEFPAKRDSNAENFSIW